MPPCAGPLKRVLGIGTGCGYQTAVLSQIAEQVYSIERIGALLEGARKRVRSLGFSNVVFTMATVIRVGLSAPFDAILVAAAPEQVPQALVNSWEMVGV